ncbi:MAG: YceI family protein [Rubritepida sp.]|nr:YceI family protein [Rubritepida sp.]
MLPARAQQRVRYIFDQSSGHIGFSVKHLRIFTSDGQFERFQASLWLDPDHPLTARVDCTLETAAVSIPLSGASDLLRSESFFDVAHYPQARFRGEAEGVGDIDGFPIPGELTLRGITRPFRMTARLAERRPRAVRFQARGELHRGEFGMLAHRAFISDTVELSVDVWLAL